MISAEEFDARLDVFHGVAHTHSATIYARLRDTPVTPGLSLTGQMRGPHCLYSTTISATVRLTDAGPGETLLAKVSLPDPCFWSPGLPALYQMQISLLQDGQVIAQAERQFGLRNFGPRGRFFYEGGKRRVIRAIHRAGEFSLLDLHDRDTSLLIANPPDEVCDEASRVGVLLIAQLDGQTDDISRELKRLSRHAAVAIVSIEHAAWQDEWKQLAPNLILAVDGGSARFWDASEMAQFQQEVAGLSQPVIAYRAAAPKLSIESARLACDQLQADLAPLGDFAGYVV